MELFLVLTLLIMGLALILIEVFFVPGTTFVGIIGLVLMVLGIVQVFANYGSTWGIAVSTVGLIISLTAIIIGFKSGVWTSFSNKEKITGRVNLLEEDIVRKGDKGVAVSDIRPGGKARINDFLLEVKSLRGFIDAGSPIVVSKIDVNSITVEEVKEGEEEDKALNA
ncbi:MAG: nodulation protein NfeD [Bacteroidia bacterium]